MKRVTTVQKMKKGVVKPLASRARARAARTPRAAVSRVRVISKVDGLPAEPAATFRSQRTQSPIIARCAALVLIAYFLVVPVADVYADTSTPATADASIVVTPTPVDVPPALPEAPVPLPTDVLAVASSTAPVAPVVAATSTVQNSTSTVASDATPAPLSAPVVSTDTPTTLSASTTGSSTAVVAAPVLSSAVRAPATSATATAQVLATPATTTPIVATATPLVPVAPTPVVTDTANQPLVVSHTTDADKMSFAVGECVIVGDGAFQCTHTHATTSNSAHTDGVYAARDAIGVMQVYYQHNGTTDTITATTYDNDAPSLDAATGDIVWHALIDDRYQIMKYEHASGHTTKLTSGTVNSMLPSSYDGTVVYQTWQGGDWDIAMIERDGTTHMLTTNDVHDVAPLITDKYVTWESRENNEWVAKVYDRSTGVTQTVHGTPGSKVENPRMVLVFDSKSDNGDVQTVGYDVAHNRVVPLAAAPAPLPKDIPQPSNQKNDQAFVQPAVALKVEIKSATGTPDGIGANGTSTPPDPTGSSTVPTLPAATSTVATSTDIQATSTVALSMLGASSTPTASTTPIAPTIPDLVIQPYNATDTATTSNVQ